MGNVKNERSLAVAIIGFITGIFLYYRFPKPLYVFPPFAVFIPFLKYSKKFTFFVIFLFSGIIVSFLKTGKSSKPLNTNIEKIEGVILSKYKETPFSSGYVVKIEKVKINGRKKRWNGKVLLEIENRKEIERGRIVEIKDVKFKPIPSPKNPGDIDFRDYWKRKNIFFVCEGEIYLKGYSSHFSFLISEIRKKIKKRIERYLKYWPEERELIETITTGKEKIPLFLKELGIKTGTYHLLVISGIHLSFILLLLKILFIPFQRINNTHPKIFPFLSLLFLWFYAEITGFRIPVVRAVLMFSFFFLGELFERDIDGISSIIMAAFTFLIFSPSSIFEVSFQLSFLATTGIILFYRRFKSLFQKNVIFSTVLLTVSAQIFVLPLVIYYFGRFSAGGIFNNIIFVPFTGIIMIFSFLFFLFPFISNFVRFILSFYLKSLTFFSFLSPLINISFSIYLLLFSYIIIFLFCFHLKKEAKFLILLFSLIFLILPHFYKRKQTEIYFFSTRNPSILIKSGEKAVFFLPDSIKEKRIERILKYFLERKKIKKVKALFYTEKSFDTFGTYRFISGFSDVEKIFESDIRKNKFSQIYAEIFLDDYIKKLKRERTVEFDGFKIEVLKSAFIIKRKNVDILILLSVNKKDLEKILKKNFDVIYSKNERFLYKANSIYYISGKRIREGEGKKNTFYTHKGTVLIDFSKEIFDISYLYR